MRFFAALGLLFISAIAVSAPVQVRVGDILALDDGSQLALDLNAPAVFKHFVLNDPPRLVIDINDAYLDRSRIPRLQQSPDIHRVRAGVRNGRDLRLVIDLLAPARNQVTLIRQNGFHLVIDLFRNAHTRPIQAPSRKPPVPGVSPPIALISKPQAPLPAPSRAPALRPPPEPQAEPGASEPAGASRAVKPQAPPKTKQPRYREREIVVAIDPGHGGKDSGALGPHRTQEKHVVLAVAKRLQKLIDKQPGMRAILTRSDDRYLHLYQRIAIARRHKADLFISVHADAWTGPSPSGSSVFTLSTRGASSAKARALAKQENAADYIGTVKDNAIQEVVFDIVHSGILSDSRDLAKQVLAGLGKIGKVHKRSVERANFAVLKAPDIPSILVETAFISNPKEEKKLNSRSYQAKLARAILDGILAYVENRPALRREEISTQIAQDSRQHVIRSGETLSGIAHRYKISLQRLITANGLNKNKPIPAGMTLTIPGG